MTMGKIGDFFLTCIDEIHNFSLWQNDEIRYFPATNRRNSRFSETEGEIFRFFFPGKIDKIHYFFRT